MPEAQTQSSVDGSIYASPLNYLPSPIVCTKVGTMMLHWGTEVALSTVGELCSHKEGIFLGSAKR